jgi:hypothetical protein
MRITFLEYVCQRLMGPPAKVDGMGRSWWLCPFHGETEPSFQTLPPHEKYKDRFRCFACNEWGDEWDLLKIFYDRENYGDRRDRWQKLREDYEREQEPYSPCGLWRPEQIRIVELLFNPALYLFSEDTDSAFSDLLATITESAAVIDTLRLMQRTLEVCAQHSLHPAVLAGRCQVEVHLRERPREEPTEETLRKNGRREPREHA